MFIVELIGHREVNPCNKQLTTTTCPPEKRHVPHVLHTTKYISQTKLAKLMAHLLLLNVRNLNKGLKDLQKVTVVGNAALR